MIAVAVCGACSVASAAEDKPTPEALRHESERMIEKARALKQGGRFDESQELADKAKQLRLRAEAIEKKAETGRPPEFPDKEHLQNLRREMEELHRLGRHEEAANLERHLRALRDRGAPDEHPEHPPGAPLEELDQRLRHLRIAIENLHAAGMHEPAEHLAQEGERMERALQQQHLEHGPEHPEGFPRGRSRPGPDAMRNPNAPHPPRPGPDPELRRELEELRHAVRELRAQVERLSRDR